MSAADCTSLAKKTREPSGVVTGLDSAAGLKVTRVDDCRVRPSVQSDSDPAWRSVIGRITRSACVARPRRDDPKMPGAIANWLPTVDSCLPFTSTHARCIGVLARVQTIVPLSLTEKNAAPVRLLNTASPT